MAYLPNKEFEDLVKKIRKTGKSELLTPKELLSFFGVTSRSSRVIWWVDKALTDNNLVTQPNYKSGWLHTQIELISEEILSKKNKENTVEDNIIPRIKLLKSANTSPTFITKNDSIEKAMTIMMENDFSQLPVMNSQKSKDVDGMISWHSIGWKKALGKNNKSVADFMSKDYTIIKDSTPLLDAVEIIKEKEVVLIKGNDGTILGLVTITDIADEFYSLAEPFLIIGQIEASIREIINDKFTLEELSSVKFSEDSREIQSVSDLTFNEYIQLLRKNNNWEKLKLPLDKNEFTNRLDQIREIRNDVMHFNTDNIDEYKKILLRKTAVFFREILG